MAKLQISDLVKHSYLEVLLDKIENGVPFLLFPENKKKFTKIEIDKEYIDKLLIAKTKKDFESIIKDGTRLRKMFLNVQTKKYITLSDISKENVKINARKGDAKTTQYQELCSLKIIEKIIKTPSKKYTIEELSEIYTDLPNEKSWIVSFEAQYVIFKKIVQTLGIRKIKIFNRDGGFMDFITKEVKRLGFPQKDSWNPADIWLIKDENVQKEIKEANFKTIEHLNAKMVELFNDRRLIGISLKKTKAKATYDIINVKKGVHENYPFLTGNLLLSLKNGKFVNDELNYDLQYIGSTKINVQVRMYPKKEMSNVQVSYKSKGASAEMGKVPAAMRNATLKMLSYDFPQGKKMPKTLEEFLKVKDDYKKMLTKIKSKKLFNLGVPSVQEALQSIEMAYSAGETYSLIELNTKLQGLHLAFYMSSITSKELDKLVTEWGFLAQKKGEKFGPFIKVY